MGRLVYGFGSSIELEDRVLDHVRRAVALRFRRGESFMIEIDHEAAVSGEPMTAWLAPAVPVAFFGTPLPVDAVDNDWVKSLAGSGRTMCVGSQNVRPALSEGSAARVETGAHHRPRVPAAAA